MICSDSAKLLKCSWPRFPATRPPTLVTVAFCNRRALVTIDSLAVGAKEEIACAADLHLYSQDRDRLST